MTNDNLHTGKVIKILFFIDSLRAGGKERQLTELLKQLYANRDFKLELLLMKKGIHYKEIPALNIPVNYLFRRNIFDVSVVFKLFKIVKRSKPHIVHTWSTITALYAGPVARLLKVKHICGSVRGATNVSTHFKSRFVDKIGFRFADKIVANSYAGIRSRNLRENEKTLCIYNGFDFLRTENLEEPAGLIKRFKIKTAKIVGMVASLDDRKDNEIFINAANRILNKKRDVSFLVVGDGPKAGHLQSLVHEKNRDYIIFTGRQDGVESLVNIFDIGVLTSKNEFFREGISNSIMEYMAFAKPVVATDSGGNSEIVEDKVTGFLVRPKVLAELVSRINYLLDNKKIAERMGQAGKRRILNTFSLAKMVNSYVELYKSLAEPGKI